MIRYLRTWLASRRLAKLTRERRQSYEIISYRKHREAALKYTRGAC